MNSLHREIVITASAYEGADVNVTPTVVEALKELCQTGGTLRFERGEYHFYEEGAHRAFYAISNNSAGEKSVVFPIIGADGLMIDGGGSTFVFHGLSFPFVIDTSRRVTLKNMIFERFRPPYARMRVSDISARGFALEIDRAESDFFVRDGSLFFVREWGIRSGKDKKYALHATSRIRERYLFTGNCTESSENLPVAYMWGDAVETDRGVYLTYREGCGADPCLYEEGERVYVLLDADREVDTIFLQASEELCVEDVTVKSGLGMGIIAQLCRHIRIRGFSTDATGREDGVTIPVDAMHFVNCDGKLEISDCEISHTGDDILNVHGIYTSLVKADPTHLTARLMHQEQRHFLPYREGDRLSLIDGQTLARVAEFRVTSCRICNDVGDLLEIEGAFTDGFEALTGRGEILIENPDRMPDLHLYRNRFWHYPNLRLSGGGAMLVEDNLFECSKSAIVMSDLWQYWYESGRIRDLVIRNNRMRGCNALGKGMAGESFLQIGVSGFDAQNAPKIHGKIEISGNVFEDVRCHAVVASGVRELILLDNRVDYDREDLIVIDGKNVDFT